MSSMPWCARATRAGRSCWPDGEVVGVVFSGLLDGGLRPSGTRSTSPDIVPRLAQAEDAKQGGGPTGVCTPA